MGQDDDPESTTKGPLNLRTSGRGGPMSSSGHSAPPKANKIAKVVQQGPGKGRRTPISQAKGPKGPLGGCSSKGVRCLCASG